LCCFAELSFALLAELGGTRLCTIGPAFHPKANQENSEITRILESRTIDDRRWPLSARRRSSLASDHAFTLIPRLRLGVVFLGIVRAT
jgi:hypothetical protein